MAFLGTSMVMPASQWCLEPTARRFIESLSLAGIPPFHTLAPSEARAMLTKLQSGPIGKPSVRTENVTFRIAGCLVRACIVRPPMRDGLLPAIIYFHGGGWVAGDLHSHDRLIREICVGTSAAVVFVDMSRAPEVRYPAATEEAYGAACYVANHGSSLNLDASRLVVAGDGTGGNIAAAVTLIAKKRRGPKINLQVLIYPVTDADFSNGSYTTFRDGPWLTRQTMKWFWDAYTPNVSNRSEVTASPLKADVEELRGLPEALIITAENDVLREEGEAYARKLSAAHTRVAATRYIGTIHDFLMLNALADSPPTRCAIEQINARLRTSLE